MACLTPFLNGPIEANIDPATMGYDMSASETEDSVSEGISFEALIHEPAKKYLDIWEVIGVHGYHTWPTMPPPFRRGFGQVSTTVRMD